MEFLEKTFKRFNVINSLRVLFVLLSFPLSAHEEDSLEITPNQEEVCEQRDLAYSENFSSINEEATDSSPAFISKESPGLVTPESKKNGLYLIMPIGRPQAFSLPGLSYRHDLNGNFLELSYYTAKESDLVLEKRNGFFDIESKEKLGSIYMNTLNVSYGFKWTTHYLDPYIALGTGVYFHYVNYDGPYSTTISPTLTTTFGLSMSYGFLDLGIHYLPIKSKIVSEYEQDGMHSTISQEKRFISTLRLGIGFPF